MTALAPSPRVSFAERRHISHGCLGNDCLQMGRPPIECGSFLGFIRIAIIGSDKTRRYAQNSENVRL